MLTNAGRLASETWSSGNIEVNGVARWTKSRWEQLGPGIHGRVVDLTVFRGDLIALWQAPWWDSVPWASSGISRWDGQTWAQIADGFHDELQSVLPEGRLAVYRDQLYVAGSFAWMRGIGADRLARWDGFAWFAVPHPPLSTLSALQVFDDKLFVGCTDWPDLMSWDGADWDFVGGPDRPWRGHVERLFVHEGRLAIAGWFTRRPMDVDGWPAWDTSRWSGGVLLWDGRHWEGRRLDVGTPWASSVVLADSR